jgi:ligand-binding sensor domain-containing protein
LRPLAILIVLSAFSLRSELLPVRTYTTADGLANFVSYGVDEGLPHRMVSTLIETRSGDYLVGTPRGLSRINPGKGAPFATYTPGREAAQNYITAVRELRNGKIWCATRKSLFEWSMASSFQRRELPLPPDLQITDVLEYRRGDMWVNALLLDSKGRM